MVCCFFGHKETPASIAAELGKVIDYLIRERNVDEFLVGNQGAFDSMVYRTLREARKRYLHISYHVVLAYLPNADSCLCEYSETYFPEGIENVPPRFAISWRNKWMVRESDIYVLDFPLLDTRSRVGNGDLTGRFVSDLVLQTLAYVAQKERESIRQRQAEGIAAAKARNVHFGRQAMQRPAEFEELRLLWKQGEDIRKRSGKTSEYIT